MKPRSRGRERHPTAPGGPFHRKAQPGGPTTCPKRALALSAPASEDGPLTFSSTRPGGRSARLTPSTQPATAGPRGPTPPSRASYLPLIQPISQEAFLPCRFVVPGKPLPRSVRRCSRPPQLLSHPARFTLSAPPVTAGSRHRSQAYWFHSSLPLSQRRSSVASGPRRSHLRFCSFIGHSARWFPVRSALHEDGGSPLS
ncbi:hypothetical protein NDU88_003217 [Pleurodeles waltl]|uniref:Uncharacterized protein n=1 Tax=Pleurodeles waltl TaxID=8319 RepID=A0AAV7UCQ8_PLEWA|nr:hypothetical protein NDU88_003217 [Pleurodeles waltl]